MNKVINLKDAREAPKAVRTSTDTLLISTHEIGTWQLPEFQRPRRINEKVKAIAEELKTNGGFISGVLTIGRVGNDKTNWLVDGQHRIEAFKISGLHEAIADVRIMHFDTMADMADEFVKLNSKIVNMRPDDILRGMETRCPPLLTIRKHCEFVGYNQIRRNTTYSPIISMAAVLRCWTGSEPDTPSLSIGGSALNMATTLSELQAESCVQFLNTADAAWGRDFENFRLWNALNLSLCMWLFRRLVLDRDRSGTKRYVLLNIAQFKKCLMSLSADSNYVDWLAGRAMGERERRPAYNRIKSIFANRIAEDFGDKKVAKLPQPAWAAS